MAAASSSCSSAPKWCSSSPRLLPAAAARGATHSKLSIPSSSKVRVSPIVIEGANVHTIRTIRLRSARASYGGGGRSNYSSQSYNSEPRSGYGGGRSSDANKMFVGNLPWSANDMSLQELFGEYGSVTEARVVKDRETGRSRGFGFVSMSSTEEMNAAIQALDGYDLDGRPIRVNQAESRF